MGTVLVVLLVEALAFVAYEAYVYIKHGKLKALVTELKSEVKGVEASLVKSIEVKGEDLLKKIKAIEDAIVKVSVAPTAAAPVVTPTAPTVIAATTVASESKGTPPDAPPPPDVTGGK
jgi:uncharacterized protein YoxC